jgi:hypothetical protein
MKYASIIKATVLAGLAAATLQAQTNAPQPVAAIQAAPNDAGQPVDAASCATKATAAKNKYLATLPKKDRGRRSGISFPGVPTPEARLANQVEKTTFDSCMASLNAGGASAALAGSTGTVAKEYDDAGKHHAVIMLDNQVILTTPVSVPGGTDSKVLFTDEQKKRVFFVDANDNNAVKEVVPVQGTMDTFKGQTFTVIVKSDGQADSYAAKQPQAGPVLLRKTDGQGQEKNGATGAPQQP